MYRKNLDAAFLAAATTPGAANPLVTATEQPWEEATGVVQVKSGFGASGVKVGTAATTSLRDAEGEFENVGANIAWSTDKFVSVEYPDFSDGLQANATDSSNIGAGYTAPGAFNESLVTSPGNYWMFNVASAWIQMDLGAARTMTRVSFYLDAAVSANTAATITAIDASNSSDMSGSVSLFSGSTLVTKDTWNDFDFANVTGYRYVRITVSKGTTYGALTEVKISAQYPLFNNAFDTTELVSGVLNYDPNTLVVKNDSAGSSTVASANCSISYSTDGGSGWSSFYTLNEFRALGTAAFSALSNLQLRLRPVGAQSVGYVLIETATSGVVLTKGSTITHTVGGVTTYSVSAVGDVTTTDITCDDITMTGLMQSSVEAGITASTTQTLGQQPLTEAVNEISTCGTTNDVVTLAAAVVGRSQTVINNGAETLQIFPASGENLGAGTDTSTTLAATGRTTFVCYATGVWTAL